MSSLDSVKDSRDVAPLLAAVPLLDVQRQYSRSARPSAGRSTGCANRDALFSVRTANSSNVRLRPTPKQATRSPVLRERRAIVGVDGDRHWPGRRSDSAQLHVLCHGELAVWRLGAMPVFVDIDPATYNICPRAAAARMTRATKAILPVHLFGQWPTWRHCERFPASGACP